MPVKSQKRGKNTSPKAEIQNISPFGLWVLVHEKEFFLPFQEYPWFKEATLKQIYNVQFSHGKHLYWPDLDIDLELESLENPQKYPLKYT